METRKIIHVDMDAFYASVEQRDNPELVGKPTAVGYNDKRGVVAAASYEARKYGVHSAMATITAKRLCPPLIFVAPRFEAYRVVSKQIHAIFAEHTDLIEPVALDEAYLDVTESKKHISSAWTTAQVIRDEIFKVTGLTASAGVSYNKFLAKTASGMRKPNGQYLIMPDTGTAFVSKLPITKFHGIGPATADKMHSLGIQTGADLKEWSLEDLKDKFGKVGIWYYHIAQGEDDRVVNPNRERKSTSSETTFVNDTVDKNEVEGSVLLLVRDVWSWVEKTGMHGRTVTLKIKWADFEQSTKSKTTKLQITDNEEFRQIISELTDSIFPVSKGIRLVGIGISNFNVIEVKPNNQTALEFREDI
jgi:DNA polymerase-4